MTGCQKIYDIINTFEIQDLMKSEQMRTDNFDLAVVIRDYHYQGEWDLN